jgi:cytochrome P450
MTDAAPALKPYPHLADALTEGTLLDPLIQAQPNFYYRELRTRDPVHYDPQLNMYLVSRYEDLQAVTKDPLTFSSERGYKAQTAKGFQEEFQQILRDHGGGFFPDAIKTDPPYHTRIRKLMDNAFTAHRVKELEPIIEAVVRDIIAGVAAQGSCDGVRDIAAPITIRFICEQMGLGDVDGQKIIDRSYAVVAQQSRMQSHDQMVANAMLIAELQQFLNGHMRDREANPREDMISDLVHARLGDDDVLTFAEAVSLVRAMLIAGNETTATAIGHLLVLLATRHDVAEDLYAHRDDDRWLNRFVEELLRWEPPSRGLTRMTTREVDLGGTILPDGAHLLLLWASGNDTETVFPDPRRFDMMRENVLRHLSFRCPPLHWRSAGPHGDQARRARDRPPAHRFAPVGSAGRDSLRPDDRHPSNRRIAADGPAAPTQLRRIRMFIRGHMQNAYVTHDLDKAMEIYGNCFGVEKWDRIDPEMTVNTVHGVQPLSVRVATYWAGGLNIEIIEPVAGYVDHYVSMLPDDKTDAVPRFHHISMRREDETEMRKEIAELGLRLAFEGPLTSKDNIPSLVFIYLDARESLGHYVEYTWKSPEGWKFVGWPEGRPIW